MKKNLIFLFFIFCLLNLQAQRFAWAKKATSSGYCYNNAIVADSAGNTYVTGQFSADMTYGPFTANSTNSPNDFDFFIAKFDNAGTILWLKTGGSMGDEFGYDIKIDSNGDVLVYGGYRDSATFETTTLYTYNRSSSYDLFLLKYSPSGSLLSANTFGGPGQDIASQMAIDAQGNKYFCGYYQNKFFYGTDSIVSQGPADDAFVLKIDVNNNLVFLKSIHSQSQDFAYSICADNLGNTFVGGRTFSDTLRFDSLYLTNSDLSLSTSLSYIAKYNSSGTIQWVQEIGKTGNDYVASMKCDANNMLYVCGTFGDQIFLNNQLYSINGSDDAFLAKFDQNGNNIWGQIPNSTSFEEYSSIFIKDDRIFVTGDFDGDIDLGNFISYSATSSSSDGIIAEYDLNGIAKYAKAITGAGDTYPTYITADTSNNLYAIGGFDGLASFGTNNLSASGGYTAFLCKLEQLSSGVINPAIICAGSALQVPYNSTITFNSGNVFTAQLSDANGDFTLGNNIGTLNSASSNGFINCTIPVASPTGSNYKIRINSTNPVTIGTYGNLIQINAAAPTPEICLVTVDSLSNFNEIYWDKTPYLPTDTFFVYRDTANNNFALIGKVPYDSLSMFIDTVRNLYPANGDPNVSSWRYKISVKDYCGIESNKSPYHQTMFIQQNSGNFSWNHYQVEGQFTPVPFLNNYLLMRDDLANGSFNIIQSLSASSNAYTDPNYLTFAATADWRVYTNWTNSCEPTMRLGEKDNIQTVVVKSKSNIKNNRTVGIKDSKNQETRLKVYPNPATDMLNVEISLLKETQATITIENMLGQVVYSKQTTQQLNQFNISTFVSGVYFVKVNTRNGIVVEKIIIE